ncbi:LysM domain protein [Salinisphaera shabanensis E1L3A]|uniref:LysM domain protein n=1 Tax=Salinisphaera shabanensis E1L3A TaxID=1033802 RepID=U2E1B7_9GAMM|nr:LysM domain-containing protein [Salinisphaera shabanensis]ERJ17711.1 LysM domain protein [Salinisphaera shabanensis E1L3A]
MREYNDLKQAMKYAGTGLTLVMAIAASGCAHQQAEPELAPAAPATPLPERAAPVVRENTVSSQLRADAPLRYVVKKGDTLWDIAGYYLRDPWYWPQLWYANPDIANPHLIYPGDVLILTRDADGNFQLRRAGTKVLSPRVRESSLESVATIPLDAIRAFITGPRLVSQEELAEAPYIVSFIDEHLVGGKGTVSYVRGVDGQGHDADRYSLVRDAGPYKDPDTGEILGQQAVPVGEIQITEYGPVAKAEITKSYREALVADRLLPMETEDLVRDFYPHAPDRAIEGRIISVYDGVSAIGQYQVVTLSLGSTDGVERGHVLDIFEAGRVVLDPVKGGQVRLPELKSGQLLVFKTDEQVSFAVIMRAERAVHIEDFVRTPAR